jgi:BirA family biotin operon repressor/biotin-[acetyl-CoA-carboxylase] ligase
MLAALACHEALGNYTEGFTIKWPNDIYWKDKKIGGILIENELEGKYIMQSIIGIGLNVNQEAFYSDAPNPVSLKQIIGAEIDIQELMMKVVHGIIGGYRQLEANFDFTQQAISKLYRKHLYRHKGWFPYRDAQGDFMAEYQEVEADGHLILKDEQGNLRQYAFKEVEFIL